MNLLIKKYLMSSGNLHGSYEWTTPGTYTFELSARTKANIAIVESGSPRMDMGSLGWWGGYGGSAFVGGVILPAGVYSVRVGGIETLAVDRESYLLRNGDSIKLLSLSGTVNKSENLEIQQGTVTVDAGATVDFDNGGASNYMGYGRGESKNGGGASAGYFRIDF